MVRLGFGEKVLVYREWRFQRL